MSSATALGWSGQAACASADPDLFFPDEETPVESVEAAKEVCAGCPVKQACLEDAIRRRDWEGIRGGTSPEERRKFAAVNRARTPGKASARQLAVKHGAYLLTCLVGYRMGVEQVAEELGSTRMAVYCAFLILVPPRPGQRRSKMPSQLEDLLTRAESLKTLERRGISHAEIGVVLGVPQSLVTAALAVLRQRGEALERLAAGGAPGDGLRRMQAEEIRVRRESGAGMTVADVVETSGPAIRRLHGRGMPLRRVAKELGLCREMVRKAHLEMTSGQGGRALTQDEMGEAA